jgi:MraZ protein
VRLSFYSTYMNKIDRKGRVSIPHAFRSQLTNRKQTALIAFRALDREAICCSGIELKDSWQDAIERLPDLSQERAALESVLGDLMELQFDPEGRVSLPQLLIDAGGLTENVVFAGAGDRFFMWNPERYAQWRETSRTTIRARGITLPTLSPAPAAPTPPVATA